MMQKARTGSSPTMARNVSPPRAYRPKHPRHGLYALGGAGGAASPKRELGGYGTGGEDLALGRAGKADSLEVGHGIGPVHHFHAWW